MSTALRPAAALAALLLLLLVLTAPARAQSDALPEIEPRDELELTLDDDAPEVRTERLAAGYTLAPTVGRTYRVRIRRSGTYAFDMRSPYFDTYLVLRDGSGEVVAEDDDGLVATHSRLVAELDDEETYELTACALHGGRGKARLWMYKGEPDPDENIEWSEEEIQVRLESVFQEEYWDKVEVVESKHYLIFTDSGAGESFGEILDEDIYEGFQEYFPFDKPDNARRMPIYLFNTRERYIDFLMEHLGMSRAQAQATGGIQYRDFYSTAYTSPRDPVHFHECAHQIMSNVLRLTGGGSWFQEGIAEYYEDKIKHFNREAQTRMMIRTDQSVSWEEMLGAASMLFSAGENLKGAGGASGNYGQAASVILFLREGPYEREFEDFLHAMGKVPRSDMQAIEAVFQEVYGKGWRELEEEWVEYFAG